MNAKVDEYLRTKANNWQRPILEALRRCILDCGLKEELKWGAPSYNHYGIVVGIGAFKNHCALWFHEGALLNDEANVLITAQQGKTTAMRQWRFQEGDSVDEQLVKKYVSEAALNMEKGRKTPKKKIEVVVPALLQDAMKSEPDVLAFFNSLAPSHRREYAQHIAEAKQESTKLRRLEKCLTLMREKKSCTINIKTAN